MLPDRVSNPGPLTYESGALPIALRGPAILNRLALEEMSFKGFQRAHKSIINGPTSPVFFSSSNLLSPTSLYVCFRKIGSELKEIC